MTYKTAEQKAEYNRLYYATNKAKFAACKERAAIWYANNKDRCVKRVSEWNAANKEHVLEYKRNWRLQKKQLKIEGDASVAALG